MNTIRRHIHRLSGGHHDVHGTSTHSSSNTSTHGQTVSTTVQEETSSRQHNGPHIQTHHVPSNTTGGVSYNPAEVSEQIYSPTSYTLQQSQHSGGSYPDDMNQHIDSFAQMSISQQQQHYQQQHIHYANISSDTRMVNQHSPSSRSHEHRPSHQSRRSYQYEIDTDANANVNMNVTLNNWEGDVRPLTRSPPDSSSSTGRYARSRSPSTTLIPVTKIASSPVTYAVQHQRQLSSNSAISQHSQHSTGMPLHRRSPSPVPSSHTLQPLPNNTINRRPSVTPIDTSQMDVTSHNSFDRKPLSASAVMDGGSESAPRDRLFSNQQHLTVITPQSPIGIPATQVILGRKSSKNNINSEATTGSRRRDTDDDKNMTEDELLVQEGIRYHEQNELEKATDCFRQAAELNNPNGMFLYGISLRHGWGCETQPTAAFKYLQKAAESAVIDISNGKLPTGVDALNGAPVSGPKAAVAKKELVLAIHELGVCFRHGWGVPKNKQTAVYYFELAANMGDPDAQNDLGFCYYHGEGVKRDLYKAAKYYRLAHKQGVSVMGNSWIFKKKYDSCGV